MPDNGNQIPGKSLLLLGVSSLFVMAVVIGFIYTMASG